MWPHIQPSADSNNVTLLPPLLPTGKSHNYYSYDVFGYLTDAFSGFLGWCGIFMILRRWALMILVDIWPVLSQTCPHKTKKNKNECPYWPCEQLEELASERAS